MQIGGLQPVTLLDYPNKVAAIVFTVGCNMRCPFCYNPNLVLPPKMSLENLMPEETAKAFLKARKKYLDGVCLTGGEPLMQPDILDFLRWLKDLGYAVKLDTNGLMTEVLAEALARKLVDYVAMDIKGPLAAYKKFAGVDADAAKIEKSIVLIKNSGLDYEFRSTIAKGFHSQDDLEKMFSLLAGVKKYYLQNFSRPGPLVKKNFAGTGFTAAELKKICQSAAKKIAQCEIRF